MDEIEPQNKKYDPWVEGRRYEKGERVEFREKIYEADHRTEVRPRLTRAWRLVEDK